jgi:hypothetical protein
MDSLVWNNVFPCLKVVDTSVEDKNYITMKFRYKKSNEANIWNVGTVTFYILCYHANIRTDYSEMRHDYLLQCIDNVINNSRNDTWLGKITFDEMDEMVVDNEGKYIIEVVDLTKNPELAKRDQIIALPTLVKQLPPPVKKIIGDLSNTEKVLVGLELMDLSNPIK